MNVDKTRLYENISMLIVLSWKISLVASLFLTIVIIFSNSIVFSVFSFFLVHFLLVSLGCVQSNFLSINVVEIGVQTASFLASRRPRSHIFGVQRLKIPDFGVQASEGNPIPPPMSFYLSFYFIHLSLVPSCDDEYCLLGGGHIFDV